MAVIQDHTEETPPAGNPPTIDVEAGLMHDTGSTTGPPPSALAYQASVGDGANSIPCNNLESAIRKLGLNMTREELKRELNDQTVAKKDQLQEMAWGSIEPMVFAFMKKNCPYLQLLHSPGKYIGSRRMFDEHNLKNIAFVGNRFPDMEPAPCEINVETFKSWIKATNADMDEVKAFYAKKDNALEFFLPGLNTPITEVTIPKFWLVRRSTSTTPSYHHGPSEDINILSSSNGGTRICLRSDGRTTRSRRVARSGRHNVQR